MNTTTGRAAAYLAAGVILAAVVGFAVWAGSTPGQHNRAGFTAEAADASATSTSDTSASSQTSASSASSTKRSATASSTTRGGATDDTRRDSARRAHTPNAGARDSRTAEDAIAADQSSGMPSGYNSKADPYLPPHAVVKDAPTSASPSRVYRPTNIVPTPSETRSEEETTHSASTEPTKQNQPLTPEAPATTSPEKVPSPQPASEQVDPSEGGSTPPTAQEALPGAAITAQVPSPAQEVPDRPTPPEKPGASESAGARHIVDEFVRKVTE